MLNLEPGGRNANPVATAHGGIGLPADAIVEGALAIKAGKATAKVDYLGKGATSIGNALFGSRNALKASAKQAGASSLRIETSPIIEQTGILQRGLQRAGFQQRANGTMWWEGLVE